MTLRSVDEILWRVWQVGAACSPDIPATQNEISLVAYV